jgi:DNA-binding XRE family transcriptional regulator
MTVKIKKTPVRTSTKATGVTAARTGTAAPTPLAVNTRKELGVTQAILARMIGVSTRSIATWERGGPINEAFVRRLRELERLAAALKKVMRADFIPRWLITPNEGLGNLSPIETLERGENDRLWRTVFLMGSGLPL